MLVRLLISCLVVLWCLGAAEAHKIQLRQESATGFPTPTDPQGLSYAELDTNFLALAAGALARSAVQSLTAGSQISCNNQALIPIIGSGGAVTLTSNPQILSPTDLPVTKFCILEGTSATNTVTLVDGNGLDLPGAASVTITLNTLVLLVYNGTDWIGFSSGGGGLSSGSAFPASPNDYDVFLVTDDSSTGACDSDVGTAVTLCYWDPVAEGWTPVGGSGAGGGAGTLDQAFDGGKLIDGANSAPNAQGTGNGAWYWFTYVDGTNVGYRRFCNAAQSTCITAGVKAEVGSDFPFANESGTTCWSFDSVTSEWIYTGGGTCVNNLLVSRLDLPFATCVGGTATRNWDDSPLLTEPAAACNAGTNRVNPSADFDAAVDEGMALSFTLPAGVLLSDLDGTLYWRAAATSGAVAWCVRTSCYASGETGDPAFNTAQCVSDTAQGTTLQRNEAAFANITTTGCAAGERMTIEVYRDGDGTAATDSMTGDALGESLVLTIRRTQ